MRFRSDKRDCLLYPEDTGKTYWDIFITLVLLTSCTITPWRIAFGEAQDPLEWVIINFAIDFFFLIDIFVIFFSAYYDSEFLIIEDRK